MRTPLRFQSQLLPRRSYKPLRGSKRGLRIAFRPGRRFALPTPVQLPPDRWLRSG